jgi:hypothetical protein
MLRSTDEELPVVYDSSLSVNYIEVGKFTKCGLNQMWILKTFKDLAIHAFCFIVSHNRNTLHTTKLIREVER